MSHNPNTLENRNGVVKTLAEWNLTELVVETPIVEEPVEEPVIEETPIPENLPEEPVVEPLPVDTIPEPEAEIGVRPRGRPKKR